MIIKLSNDLKNQEIFANGTELASIMGKDRKNGKRVITYPKEEKQYVCNFKNPVLLTDNYRISKLNPTLRDTLFALYASHFRIVEYDNVSVFTDPSHLNVWCPSIDTVLFAKALKDFLKNRKGFKKAIEIGCGSGYLSKYLLEKNKEIKSILINDINPFAIKCAMDNIKDSRVLFYQGDGIVKIKDQKFDLMICNPPYIPRPNSIDDNPYEGIGLLNHLVHEGQKYLNPNGVIITNVSNLCWKAIFSKKPKMKMKILAKMKVPLKVNNILNNKSWVEYLRSKGLKKIKKGGYEYWQEINIISLENTE
jgi:SAM-dependent methyltransferase